MATSFKEHLCDGYSQVMDMTDKPLVSEKTQYQRVKIFDTKMNGRVMSLDNVVQISTRDESAYAEMLTHLPMLEHGKVHSVMIIGGGDLSVADEALKHKGVQEVVLVDIDARVVELCQKYFSEVNAKAFKDRRIKIEICDAFEYLARKESRTRFDLIVGDRPDPIGPGAALFGDDFYKRVKRALKPGGFAVFQNGVPFYQPEELTESMRALKRNFVQCGVYLTVVPSYVGGFMALSWAGKGARLGAPKMIKKAERNYKRLKLKTDYYCPAIHAAAFALPVWMQNLLPSGAGAKAVVKATKSAKSVKSGKVSKTRKTRKTKKKAA